MSYDLSSQRVDTHLTNFALAEFNDPSRFVSDMIAPYHQVPSDLNSGLIQDNGNMGMTIVETKKAERAKFNTIVPTVDANIQYALEDHWLDWDITENEMKDTNRLPIDVETNFTQTLLWAMRLAKENELMSKFNSTDVPNYSALSGTARWSDATSNPFGAMQTVYDSVRTACGRRPNQFVIAYDVISALRTHPDFIAKISGITSNLPLDKVISIIENDFMVKVVVPDAMTESGANYADIFGNKFAALVTGQTMSAWTTVRKWFAYTFTTSGIIEVKKLNVAGTRDGMSRLVNTYVRVYQKRDLKIVDDRCAGMLDTVISA